MNSVTVEISEKLTSCGWFKLQSDSSCYDFIFQLWQAQNLYDIGRDIVASLQYGARCPCGYCHITDVEDHKREDHMESFFLAETVKYLWLLFDLAVGPDNLVENGPYKYIFSTEGHLLPATPQLSLVREQCSYYGAYCKNNKSRLRRGQHSRDVSRKFQEANFSRVDEGWNPTRLLSAVPGRKRTSGSGLVKGFFPGLSHGQKFGISYLERQLQTQAGSSNHEAVSSTSSNSVIVLSDTPVSVISETTMADNSAEESSKSENESPPRVSSQG